MKTLKSSAPYICALTVGVLTACNSSNTDIEYDIPIMSPQGAQIGTLELSSESDDGVEVEVSLTGLSEGIHAMHFHETGRCDAPDFKSAGGHYNPTNKAHGKDMPGGPHAGDMMNISVGADGEGKMEITNSRVSIQGESSLPALMDADGSALIIHEKADDYTSQPSGAAGARIGCAVISGG